MKLATITILFWTSLIVGLPLGIALMILWAKKIMKPLVKKINEQRANTLSIISGRSFLYMLPGVALFILCAIPVLYFSNLITRERYCVGIVKMNKNIAKDDPFLKERCACIDIDELFEKVKLEQATSTN